MSFKSSNVVRKLSDADEFDRALDSIESQMKTAVDRIAADPNQLVITPEGLRKIVTAAVNDAIARYELARNRNAALMPLPPSLRLMPNMQRLQDEMGLGEIEFDAGPAAKSAAELSKEAESFVYVDPTDAALSAWDDALKRLTSELATDGEPQEG